MRSARLAEDHCLNCGKQIDAASSYGDDARDPRAGDITICIECGHIMAFGDDLKVRALNDQEMQYVAGNREVLLMQRALAAVKKEHPRK